MKVVSDFPVSSSVVSVDDWIPLKLQWSMRFSVPLYLYVRDPITGFVELRIDPDSGELLDLIVIDLPTPIAGRTYWSSKAEEGRVVALDRTPWGALGGYSGMVERYRDQTLALSYVEEKGRFLLNFGDLPPRRFLNCGNIQLGVSCEETLASVCAVDIDWPNGRGAW